MARETLDAQRQLIDPVWGGVSQYSTDGDWVHPHFEKIMQFQAENLRVYAESFALWKEPTYLDAAEKIHGFLRNFLTSPEGAFYTSQDADLKQGEHSAEYFALDDGARRKLGVPQVDRHIYTRENAWAINALATLYGVTGDAAALGEAIRAAEWIIENRTREEGGFRHNEKDAAGPFLGDQVYLARAFLTLYEVTADLAWLRRAEETTRFAAGHFKGKIGYVTFEQPLGAKLKPKPQVDENTAFARLGNLLQHYTGKPEYRAQAQHAMAFLAAPGVAKKRGFLVGGILLADRELSAPPLHVTVVGRKNDPKARALFAAARALPVPYKRIEWSDPTAEKLPNPDVEFPPIDEAAAFVCTDRRCSRPIIDGAQLAAFAGIKSAPKP
ncbi:MAG: hypothetical protein ABI883_09425, partial [Chthoniobacterales bacterium]